MPTESLSPQLAQMRLDYAQRTLSEDNVASDPMAQFAIWLDEAITSKANEPNAMTLATCENQRPDARVVLLKGIDSGFVFYTNYLSRKGEQLARNANAALCFWWPELERQVRVRGTITRTSESESEAYFRQRPRMSQIGAAASDQSRVIESRMALEKRFADLEARYPAADLPRPPEWGGYRLSPEQVEFWQGRRSRLHDRVEYMRDEAGAWVIRRLQP